MKHGKRRRRPDEGDVFRLDEGDVFRPDEGTCSDPTRGMCSEGAQDPGEGTCIANGVPSGRGRDVGGT